MPDKRPKVIVTRRLPVAVETRMRELFDVRLSETDQKMSRAALIDAMREADVIVPCVTDRIDAQMLDAAGGRLKLIANYGAGVDHIDVVGAHARGVLVSNTPGVMTEDTADMALGLILAVTRRMPEGMKFMQSGEWGGWAPTAFMGQRIGGKSLGILAWAGSDGPWRGVRRRLACRCIITIVRGYIRPRKRITRHSGGTVSIRCWRGSMWYRSTAPIRPPRSI